MTKKRNDRMKSVSIESVGKTDDTRRNTMLNDKIDFDV